MSSAHLPALQGDFPQLTDQNFGVTSCYEPEYNCIAWAAGDTSRAWWPCGQTTPALYWPLVPAPDASVPTFLKAFATLGFEPCEDGDVESGFDKLAIYADKTGSVTHMARLLAWGAWTSKLGKNYDIQHKSVDDLSAGLYGQVVKYIKRPRTLLSYYTRPVAVSGPDPTGP